MEPFAERLEAGRVTPAAAHRFRRRLYRWMDVNLEIVSGWLWSRGAHRSPPHNLDRKKRGRGRSITDATPRGSQLRGQAAASLKMVRDAIKMNQ